MNKVSIIFWQGWLESSPTTISLIEFLSEKRIRVDVYLRDDGQFDLSVISNFDSDLVRFFRIRTTSNDLLLKYLKQNFSKLKYFRINLLTKLSKIINKEINWIVEYKKIRKFIHAINIQDKVIDDVTFCIDSLGLYVFKKSNIISKRVINVSLEITPKSDAFLSGLNFTLKRNEIWMLNHEIYKTIIQDENRWELYAKTNRYTGSNYLLLPNSTRINSTEIMPKEEHFFHQLFNLSLETVIVLSAGLITSEVSSFEISMVVGKYKFSKPTKIIFHSAHTRNQDAYLKEVKEVGGSNVLFSLVPVPYIELSKIFLSSTIGLVIYNKENVANMSMIGLSSGKLFQYLKYGIPVIASNLPGLNLLVNENKCGIVIDSYNEIPSAIEKILQNYQTYSRNARLAFKEKFNIDIYLDRIFHELSS